MTAIHCIRCHRTLTDPASRARGMGPTCAAKAAAERTYTPTQLRDAELALADRATARLRRDIHLVVSTDGTATHRTTRNHCSCPAGLRGAACYHTAAIRLRARRTAPRAPRAAIAL